MKYFIILLIGLTLVSCEKNKPVIETQKLTTEKLSFDGLEWEYLLYIPESYTGEEPVPVLLNFHGLGGNMNEQFNRSRFDLIAEQENFILITPQGRRFFGVSRWTLNPSGFNATDDVGFVNALLDEITQELNIDKDRIYSTGMSNGGFFSFELACKMSNRIAAVASVTGTMSDFQINNCQPSRIVPILQIHGTSDNIVRYETTSDVIGFWNSQNGTDQNPVVEIVSQSVTHFSYKNSNSVSLVEHFKVENGKHVWFGEAGEEQGFGASREVWNFLSKFDLNGKIE